MLISKACQDAAGSPIPCGCCGAPESRFHHADGRYYCMACEVPELVRRVPPRDQHKLECMAVQLGWAQRRGGPAAARQG